MEHYEKVWEEFLLHATPWLHRPVERHEDFFFRKQVLYNNPSPGLVGNYFHCVASYVVSRVNIGDHSEAVIPGIPPAAAAALNRPQRGF